MGELSKTTINGVSYDFKDAGAARQSHSHTKSQITDFPTLGTAASKNVPSSGNASTSQVVMGNDSRLSDARTPTSHTHTKSQITDFPTSMPASDVYSWAKQSSKPSYTASEVGAIATSAKGAANGVASLDSAGKVPSSQLPSYVDDVLEYSAKSSFPSTGETGKIYVDTSTNKTYRWSGSAYVEISASLALGETSSTAYYGDKGKTAYSHSQVTSGNPHNVTKSDVGLGNVGNFKAVSTVASQGLSSTEQANARANIGAGTGNGTYSKPSGGIPKSDLASAVQTSLGRADSALQSFTETDPTVPSWAKQSSKPSYSASEVGAAASSHTHGNIQNGGTLQTNDITIARGDKLVVTDSSDSSKIARASLSFDGSTTSQALTKAGKWATFNNYSHPTDGANTGSFGPSISVSPGFGDTFNVPYLTVNNKGHVTAASTKTITMPTFTATPYTQPTKHSNITSIDDGGYIQIGKLTILNMRFTVGTACGQWTDIFTDCPLPLSSLSGGYGVVACSSNTDQAFAICANGRLQNYSGTLNPGSYVVSACYMTQ